MTSYLSLFAISTEPLVAAGVLLLVVTIAGAVIGNHVMSVARAINRHVGRHWKQATVLTRPMLNWERVNLFLALEALRGATPNAPRVMSLGYFNEFTSALAGNANRAAPLEYAVKATSLTTTTKVVTCGVYLLEPPGLPPFAALLS